MADPVDNARRGMLKALPAALTASALPVAALASARGPDFYPVDPAAPFLHVADERCIGEVGRRIVQPGDLLLCIPGISSWDDVHLMTDGSLAAIQVCYHPGLYGVYDHATGARWEIPRSGAGTTIRARIDRILFRKNGEFWSAR